MSSETDMKERLQSARKIISAGDLEILRLVVAMTKMAAALGLPTWVHPQQSADTNTGFVSIGFQSGTLTWNVRDVRLFAHLPVLDKPFGPCNGLRYEEKYEKLAAMTVESMRT